MNEEELKKLRELGTKGKLWHMVVWCNIIEVGKRNETCKWERSNLLWPELMDIRQTMFAAGLMFPTGPTSYILVAPGDIGITYIDRQSKFFEL